MQKNTTDCMNDTLDLHCYILMYGVLRELHVDVSIEMFTFQNMRLHIRCTL